ncbi:MAG: hypothetical protein Q4A65_08635, partial [Bacillota bacterium]|nr:hypothetical protein [Bacillota bacterium]
EQPAEEETEQPAETEEEQLESDVISDAKDTKAAEAAAARLAAKQIEKEAKTAKPAGQGTPMITIVLYILGILFLLVSLFMLVTGINYTKVYLESYDATFADMWSNSVQYVLGQFVPYLAFGVISLGLGRAIKEFRAGRSVETVRVVETPAEAPVEAPAKAPAEPATEAPAEPAKAPAETPAETPAEPPAAAAEVEEVKTSIEDLTKEIATLREIMNIKFEETEKRQKIRLEDNRQILEDNIAGLRTGGDGGNSEVLDQLSKIIGYFDIDGDGEVAEEELDYFFNKRERRFIK